MRGLAAYVRGDGLKLGNLTWTQACGGSEGSYGHDERIRTISSSL